MSSQLPSEVDDVRGDEREHQRPDVPERRQVAAECGVDEQRPEAQASGSRGWRAMIGPTAGCDPNEVDASGERDEQRRPAAARRSGPARAPARASGDTRQSRRRRRPARPTVSSPSSVPMPNTAMAKNRLLDTPTPPSAAGPSGPTMIVSTMPMTIQPISARTTGPPSRASGGSSCAMARRIRARRSMSLFVHVRDLSPAPDRDDAVTGSTLPAG